MNGNYTNALIKRTFERHLDPTCGFFGIRLAKTFNLLPKRMKLGLHKFGLNSKCFFKILRLVQFLYEFAHSDDVFNTLILLLFAKLRPARRKGRNGPLEKIKINLQSF